MIQILKKVHLGLLIVTFFVVAMAGPVVATAAPAPNFGAAAICGPGEVHLRDNDTVCCPATFNQSANACFFAKYINPIIALLSAIVGVVVIISIIIGGIQYSSASGDPSKLQAAKSRITNSIIGLVAFFFLFAFIQWVVPGGLL